MSLSFVSKSVLTATSEGGYEEKPIEGKETGGDSGISRGAPAKPLFEQLRANKEQEEQEREEFQKSIMRGTLALDEEDCAHLDALQKERQERQMLVEQQTQSEMEAFRAAQAVNRMERSMATTVQEEGEDNNNEETEKKKEEDRYKDESTSNSTAQKKKPSKFIPKIIAKKKRKIGAADEDANKKSKQQPQQKDAESATAAAPASTTTSSKNNNNTMAGLLDGYGSSSSEE